MPDLNDLARLGLTIPPKPARTIDALLGFDERAMQLHTTLLDAIALQKALSEARALLKITAAPSDGVYSVDCVPLSDQAAALLAKWRGENGET